jgi:uncharacterized protein (DUF433 family)
MNRPAIIDRGRGPEIAGTRITVFHVLEYQRAGMHRDAIAVSLGLSSDQVEAALDFIREHAREVGREYEKIRKRIERGNPAWIEEKLRESHAKLEAFRKRLPSNVNESGTDAQGTCVGQ